MLTYELCWIRWEDSKCGHAHWQFIEESAPPPTTVCIVESVGYVIAETENSILLASNVVVHGADPQYSCDITIPKTAILDRQWIE